MIRDLCLLLRLDASKNLSMSMDFKTNLLWLSGNYFVRLPVQFSRTNLLIPTHLLYVEWKVNSTKVLISLKLLLVTVDVGSTYCTHRIKHHSSALKMSECLIHQTRALLHCSKGNAYSQVHTEFFSQEMQQKH